MANVIMANVIMAIEIMASVIMANVTYGKRIMANETDGFIKRVYLYLNPYAPP